MTRAHNALAPGEIVAARIREVRSHRGWSQEKLSTVLEGIGYRLPRSAINKIEKGGRGVSLEDLLAVATALNCAPIDLMTPHQGQIQPVRVAPKVVVEAARLRSWIRGHWPLQDDDDRAAFFREIPQWEFDALLDESLRKQPDARRSAVEHYVNKEGGSQ